MPYLLTLMTAALMCFAAMPVAPARADTAGQPSRAIDGPTYGRWHSARIGGGGYVIDFIPTSDPSIYYMHTDVGGFYRSDDGGESWRMIQGSLPATLGNQQPAALVVDPRDPDAFLVATGSHWEAQREGVYRSTDGGKTYTRTLEAAFAGNGNERMWGRDMAVDPRDPDVVIAASMLDGVYRSEDFGQTWTKTGLEGINPTDVVFDLATPGRVLIAAQPYKFFLLGNPKQELRGGLFESTDGGRTWSALADVTPAPFEMVPYTWKPGDDDWIGIFPPSVVKHSSDGARTWQDFSQGLPVESDATAFDADGVISPVGSVAPSTFSALGVGPGFVLLGGGDGTLYRREAGDEAWVKINPVAHAPDHWYGNPGERPGWVHFGKAISSLVVDPHDPGRWWLTDWYMLWDSTNGGRDFDYAGPGVEVTVIHNVTQQPDDPGLVHMGMGDNGYFRSLDGGASYRNNPQVITNNIKDVAVSPADPNRLYAIGPSVPGHWYSSHLFVSDDRGTTWRAAAMEGTRDEISRRINSLAADPVDPDRVYIAVAGEPGNGGGVFVSDDTGETWSDLSDGLHGPDGLFKAEIWHVGRELAVGPKGGMVAISSYFDRVFRRGESDAAWVEVAVDATRLNAVAADPFTPGNFLIASLDDGLLESRSGGANWTPINGIDRGVGHVAFDLATPGRTAAGSTDGVYLSTDDAATWTRLDSALPNRISNPVAFAGDRVIAGTSGSGMFYMPLDPQAADPVVASSVSVAVEPAAPELLTNSAFTDATDGIPTGWRLRWSDVDAARLDQDRNTFVSAPASLRFTVPKPGVGFIEQALPIGLSQLRVAGRVKAEGHLETATLAVQLFDADDNQLAWITLADIPSGADWHGFKKTIQLPTDYTKASLLLYTQGNGQVWLDDLSVTSADP